MADAPDHTVLYDGNCGFCKWMMAGILAWDRAGRLRPLALQRPEAERLLSELTPEQRMASWHLIAPDGSRRSGGAAIAPLMRVLPAGGVPAAVLERIPGPVDSGYRWVAGNRTRISRFIPLSLKRAASITVARVEAERAEQWTSAAQSAGTEP